MIKFDAQNVKIKWLNDYMVIYWAARLAENNSFIISSLPSELGLQVGCDFCHLR